MLKSIKFDIYVTDRADIDMQSMKNVNQLRVRPHGKVRKGDASEPSSGLNSTLLHVYLLLPTTHSLPGLPTDVDRNDAT